MLIVHSLRSNCAKFSRFQAKLDKIRDAIELLRFQEND